ncbi:MAG: hypothetical protein AAGH65_00235 [Pseudomonadota bacterium]
MNQSFIQVWLSMEKEELGMRLMKIKTKLGSFIEFWFVALIALALGLNSEYTHANTVQWPPPEPVQQRLNQALDLLDDLAQLAPEFSEDLNDMAFSMDFDTDAAINYVRDEIHFVPYRGVMRGAEGTIRTASGNAWDQAMLLAALIQTIGGDAQLVSGNMPKEDAERLLNQLFLPADNPAANDGSFQPEMLIDRVDQYDSALAELLKKDIESASSGEQDQALQRDSERIASALIALMDQQNASLSPNMSTQALIEMLSEDYAWVRWRLGPGSEWQESHPAFAADDPPAATAAHFIVEEIPIENQHRMAFELFIERKTGQRVERIPVMGRFERPVAQLYKNQLTLGMGPLPNANVSGGAILIPLLNGQLAPGAQAVTALGLTADASDAASAAGELFATISSGLGDALSGLGRATGSENDTVPRLTGIILRVESIEPGQATAVVERRMIDLREIEDDPVFDFPESASFGLVLDIDIGAEQDAALTQKLIANNRLMLEALPVLTASARDAISIEQMQQSIEVRQLGPAKWLDYDLASARLLPSATSTMAAFRSTPMLASRRTFTDPNGESDRGLLTVTDILFNPIQVVRREPDGNVVLDTHAAVLQGVRETLIESELALNNNGWRTRLPNELIRTSAQLQQKAEAENWPLLAVNMANDDLNAGYLLSLTNSEQPHWWRVHGQTGQTLGMSRYGGSDATFYIVLVGGAALSTYFFAISVESCDATYPNDREMADCCIVGNLATTYGTSVAAGGTSTALAKPWSAASGKVIAELGKETATNFIVGEVSSPLIESACTAYLNR